MPDWRPEISARLAGLKLEPTREAEIVGELSQHLDDRYAVLLRPLPYPQPDRLMMIFTTAERDGQRADTISVYGPDFIEWREQCQTCEQMAAYVGTWPGNLTGGAEPERVRVARVTDGLFATLDVKTILGRTF